MDQFTYEAAGNIFQWELPASPAAVQAVFNGFSFTLATDFTQNGTPVSGFISFFNADPSAGGGLEIDDSSQNLLANAFGPQVYGGSEANPTFVPGVYGLLDFLPDPNGVPGVLTITEVAPVPEPPSGVSLGIGLLGLAILLRTKRTLG